MKNGKWIKIILSVGLNVLLATELSLLVDAVGVFLELRMTPVVFAAVWAAVFGLLLLCRRKLSLRGRATACLGIPAGVLVLCLLGFCLWNGFQRNARYADVDTGKEKLYAGRSVMVIVPHQDDEYNILGGVIEEFVNYGSTVRVVYVTNGDGAGVAARDRYHDAIDYCVYTGIPEENVIFLGYGDQWGNGPDIYNAEPEAVLTSNYGAVSTYGAEDHGPYRDGRSYTRNNLYEDMRDVILEYLPDTIFCVDLDDHDGHESTSLLFEEIMGQMLKQNPDYQPVVFKGYAYGTAWYGENDFYALNMLSTDNLYLEPYYQFPVIYDWQSRVRFPVDAATLSRSVWNSGARDSLLLFASQPDAANRATGIVNADRVFWQRRTDSLCTDADIQVSSGDKKLLNDFQLVDNKDLVNCSFPGDGVWIPEAEDAEKCITVNLAEPGKVDHILLYDNPALGQDVRRVQITFDDGTTLQHEMNQNSGIGTCIPVNKESVSSFSVRLVDTTGENAGLTEIEAYADSWQGDMTFLKLMDENGDFAYDYCLAKGDTATFSVYRYGEIPGSEAMSCHAMSDNEKIRVTLDKDKLTVVCPEGEAGTVKVTYEDGSVSDSIYIRNPGLIRTLRIQIGQQIEYFANCCLGRTMSMWLWVRICRVWGLLLG